MKLNDADRQLLRAVSKLTFLNPFVEERLTVEADLMGGALPRPRKGTGAGPGAGPSLAVQDVWEARVDDMQTRLLRLLERERAAVLDKPGDLDADEAALWLDAVRFAVYHRYRVDLDRLILAPRHSTPDARRIANDMREMFLRYMPPVTGSRSRKKSGGESPGGAAPASASTSPPAPYIDVAEIHRLVALFYQIRRAFLLIFERLVGSSPAMSRLRARIWEAVLTGDLQFYSDALRGRMRDFAVLILGESGTGKELVARAIGHSQFIAWDAQKDDFASDFREHFHGCNIAQFAETLLESELFGYVKGAYTGAVRDGDGILRVCPPGGVVFLDEVGDLRLGVQVKLLRVLQTRRFNPIGSRDEFPFHGRLVSATNRDLQSLVELGDLREDFLFRLASTTIPMPPLRQRLSECPEELDELLGFIVGDIVGAQTEEGGAGFAERAIERMREPLARLTAAGYTWPGNVRELEQAVRSILMHGNYRPLFAARPGAAGNSGVEQLVDGIRSGSLAMKEVRDAYCRHVYGITGSYQAAGERIEVDWRTVKAAAQRAEGEEPQT